MRKSAFFFLFALFFLSTVVCQAQRQNIRGFDQKDFRALIVYNGKSLSPDQFEFINSDIEKAIEIASGSPGASDAVGARSAKPVSAFSQRLSDFLRSVAPGERYVVIIRTATAQSGPAGSNLKPNCKNWSCPWNCDTVGCGEGFKLLSCCAECNDIRACCTYSCIRVKPAGTPMFGGRLTKNSIQPVGLVVIIANREATQSELSAMERYGLENFDKESFPAGSKIREKKWLPANF